MLLTDIQKGNYQDSINLMLLTNEVNVIEGVNSGQVMMATDANKDIFKGAGLYTDELVAAGPNDMAIVVDAEEESVLDKVKEVVEGFLSDLSSSDTADKKTKVSNWEEALEALPDANLALISIPGQYAADEIERALDEGLNVFSFSDNVSIEDEARLKEKAHEKGLVLMGPDSGTGIVSGVPLAFTNVVNSGNIGIVGASGTGIQETTTIIDRLGGGVVNAIGTGGRDLSEEVGARTMLDAIYALEEDAATDVVLVISKPPAKDVRNKVVNTLQSLSKPAVAIFLGEKPAEHVGNVSLAYTLEEAAKMAMDLANGNGVAVNYTEELAYEATETLPAGKTVKGLYSGGTLASEASMLITDALGLGENDSEEGFILNVNGFQVADLGDDMYTQGRPHPMIDSSVRLEKLNEAIEDENTGVLLFDVVLGYGSHANMAGELAGPIKTALDTAKENNRPLYAVATVVGTNNDPQGYEEAVSQLEDAGIIVAESNEKAVRTALALMGEKVEFPDKQRVEFTGEKEEILSVSEQLKALISSSPKVINVGLESFVEPIEKFGGQAVQYSWRPKAGGNPELIKILNAIEKMPEIQEANKVVTQRMQESQPFLMDVRPAHELIPALNTDEKIILHAGAPLAFEDMTGPAVGAIVGAMIYEGWAKDEKDAIAQVKAGEVIFDSCHHHGAVGPMGGITTKNFPLLVIENKVDGTRGYCALNEGIGKVMRFGANGPDVIARLNWQRDVLGPVLSKALSTIEGGLNVNVILAQAITMGDEFHQRNIAASALFLNEMAPIISGLEEFSIEDRQAAIKFLADTDQFFLNIAMATGKAVVDYARKHKEGTIVTTMARNGHMFGVRIAGMGDQWFTAPVNTPTGLYFTGYSEEDGNPDIGDSAITETIGLGGISMIAAPGVTRFVGAGGFNEAAEITNTMDKVFISNNSTWSIPNWDFKGTPSGLDSKLVVETGIEPIINTGIANKVAGQGQVGAGTVTAPVQAFEKALRAYADKLGIEYN